MPEGRTVEMIKCPGCGANNSAKRQICHMCGHLLSASPEKAEGKEGLQLVSEELKAAAQAAIREATRSAKPSSTERESVTKESAPSEERRPRTSKQRERVILAISALITLVAIGYLLHWLLPKRARTEIPSTGTRRFAYSTESGPASVEQTPIAPLPPVAAILPAPSKPAAPGSNSQQATPQEKAGNEEEAAAANIAAMEETAIKAAQTHLTSLFSRIGADLGVGLYANANTFRAAVNQQGDDTSVVVVSFQGNIFSGTTSILLRRYDQGWKSGWQASHYRDVQLSFSPPIVVRTGEEGAEEDTITGAVVGTGGFEPLSSLDEQPVDYTYG